MAIVARIQLGSSFRRVQLPQPKDGGASAAYEHIYHELILVKDGGPDHGLPPDRPGLPTVGVPDFPDNALPNAPSVPNHDLPKPGYGWPGCSGGTPDNSLPRPERPADPDYGLGAERPSTGPVLPGRPVDPGYGIAEGHPDQGLPPVGDGKPPTLPGTPGQPLPTPPPVAGHPFPGDQPGDKPPTIPPLVPDNPLPPAPEQG